MSILKYVDNIWDYIEDTLRPRHIDHTVNSLKPEVTVATIAAPPYAGLDDLMSLAAKHGIRKSENQRSKLTLIPIDARPEKYREDSIKILLLPVEKKYVKILRRLDPDQAKQARCCREKLARNSDDFDIILNEGESTRRTLLTLIHKINLLQSLREMQQRPTPAGTCEMSCFIIWGHGLKYKNEITKIIEEHFQIITVQNITIPDITRFIRTVYIEEILKIGCHIIKKNKHLLKHKKQVALILAKNKKNNQTFICHGHGPSQRVCSSMQEHLKQIIRDKYNPRKTSGIRSEQHVIHGTNSPLQIENILTAFKLKPLKDWLENGQMPEESKITDCLNWQDADFKHLRLRLQSQRKDNLQTELKIRRENIEALSQVFRECNIPFWLHGKTLLGIIRHKQLLTEDHDDDVGVFAEHRAKIYSEAYTRLKETGFQAIRCNNTMLSVIRNDRYIDICFFERKEDRVGYANKWFPKEYFEKFESIPFHCKEYLTPGNPTKLLEIMYPNKTGKTDLLLELYKPVKKIKRKIKRARQWIKRSIMQKRIIRPLRFEEFLDCKIEDDAAINWSLRAPHLDLVTNKGRIKKIRDIIEYFKTDANLEYVKNHLVIETDTSQPFSEPVNLNNKFWQTGNNYLFYCIYYGFRKNVISYDMANSYIKTIKEPKLYSAEYFEMLPQMSDSEIESLLKTACLIVDRGAIVHGKHRACAMIGRIIAGKSYIPFYIEEHVPRFI